MEISAKESLGYYELRKHMPRFDEECTKGQKNQVKFQDPSEVNGDNLNNMRREASRKFRNKKKEHLKDKFNELATGSKNKNIIDLYRGINEFNRGYQPRSNLVKDENGDLLACCNKTVSPWKSYFSQLLNVYDVSKIRQIEMHTAVRIGPVPSHLEVEIALANLRRYKSPGSDQIMAELVQARGETLVSVLAKLINSICNKEELIYQWKVSISRRVEILTEIIFMGYHCC
jgi:hypothetical protein